MNKVLLLTISIFLSYFSLHSSAPEFQIRDFPWDDGKALILEWRLDAVSDSLRIQKYDSRGHYVTVYDTTIPSGTIIDDDVQPDEEFQYRLIVYNRAAGDSVMVDRSMMPLVQWYNAQKTPLLVMMLLLSGAILYYIIASKRGKEFFIRRISALDSMEEAIGRATEKGKPILFVPGIGDLDDIQTIAGLTILSHLATRAAQYDADIIVPVRFSMVLTAAREVVKEAYTRAERADAYRSDRIFYLTDDQFGYVAGIDGIMVREQPAANFFLGSFYAESLILAETGFSTGAIQTAGTAMPHQIPFFVVACDWTLIGEELFAASAYLSRDAQQLGSLKGHDFGKLLCISLIVIGAILEYAGVHWLSNMFNIG